MPKINNVFIVDNSKPEIVVAERMLSKQDFAVHSFTDPEKALDAMGETSPEIILLDYFMPSMTGADFMVKVSERLLSNPNWQVYLVSSKDFEEEERVSMLTLGITKIFQKPLNRDELFKELDLYQKL